MDDNREDLDSGYEIHDIREPLSPIASRNSYPLSCQVNRKWRSVTMFELRTAASVDGCWWE